MSAVGAWLTAIGDLDEPDFTSPETSSAMVDFFSIDVRAPLVSVLQNDLWDSGLDIDQTVKSANLLDGSWPGYVELAKSYLSFCYSVDPNDCIASFDAYARFFLSLQSAYMNVKGSVLNDVVIQATKTMLWLYARAKEELKWISGILQRIFNSIRSEKPADGVYTKRTVLLFIAGALCRVYFLTNQYSSCSTVFNNIHTASIALSHHPMAQQVEFRYWLGRYHLNRNSLTLAFKHLHWCYTHCPVQFSNHSVILKYLLLPSILLGRLPTRQLLDAYGLSEPFWPLVHSLKTGTFAGYNHVKNHQWFHKHNLDHLLIRNMPIAIWRRALVRLHKCADTPKQLKFDLMASALTLSQAAEPITSVEAESVGIALISSGLLKGIDLPATEAFLLRNVDPWPSPMAVNNIMDGTLGPRDQWMNT